MKKPKISSSKFKKRTRTNRGLDSTIPTQYLKDQTRPDPTQSRKRNRKQSKGKIKIDQCISGMGRICIENVDQHLAGDIENQIKRADDDNARKNERERVPTTTTTTTTTEVYKKGKRREFAGDVRMTTRDVTTAYHPPSIPPRNIYFPAPLDRLTALLTLYRSTFHLLILTLAATPRRFTTSQRKCARTELILVLGMICIFYWIAS